MNAFEWFLLWATASVIWSVVELTTEDVEAKMVPRCVRCGGMREFGHRCPDAVEGNGGGGGGGEIVVDT